MPMTELFCWRPLETVETMPMTELFCWRPLETVENHQFFRVFRHAQTLRVWYAYVWCLGQLVSPTGGTQHTPVAAAGCSNYPANGMA